jgi:HK97 family phage major capsid protein
VPSVEPSTGAGPDLNDQLRALARAELRSVNIAPPGMRMGFREARAALESTPANAGTLTQPTFVARVLEGLRLNVGVLMAGPEVFTTATGEQMDFPRLTARPTPTRVAEGTTISKSDASFDRFSLHAYKYGTILQISNEMIEDAQIDIAGYLANLGGIELGRLVQGDFLTGNGTGQPYGVLTRATLGATSTAAANGDPVFDDLIKTQYSVIDAYRRNGTWMMHDTTVGKVRSIKDGQGRYIWEPSTQVDAPDTLLGKPVVTDVNMPLFGTTGNKAVVFGDFSKYFVRQVHGLRVERSTEYAFDTDLISFKLVWRADGDLSDLTGAIKYLKAA